jgi:hypothetical protein
MTLENHKSDLFYDPFADRVDSDFDRKFGKIRRKTIESDRSSNSRSDRDDVGSRRSDDPENSDDEGVNKYTDSWSGLSVCLWERFYLRILNMSVGTLTY